MTYQELDESSDRIAAGLRAHGIGSGDRVGLRVERGWPVVAGILGILKAGACYVPLDPAYPDSRVRFMCADSGLVGVLGDRRGLAGVSVEQIDLADLISSRPSSGAMGRPTDPAHDDPAYVIYTSGSTGQPKGVIVTHGNVLALLARTLPLLDLRPEDRWSLFHSYSFDFSVWEMWGPIATGACAVVVPADVAALAEEFVELLERAAITVLNQVPSVFSYVAAAYVRRGAPPLALRYVVFGGEALERAPIRAVRTANPELAVRWVNMYGITETTVHATFKELTPADIDSDELTPIGEPLPHLGVTLLDEGLRPCQGTDPGELWIYGDGVAAGYLKRPELTAQRFVNMRVNGSVKRCYRTGDIVRRRADGGLEYIGRADDQVKIRGFRIEVGEVEAALREHPAISSATVVKVDAPTGATLVAVVVPATGGESVTTVPIREFLAKRLPAHMLPSRIATVDALPLAPSGKVDRKAVLALAQRR